MKQLTAKDISGKAYYPECFKRCGGIGSSSKCDKCEISEQICETLAGYESKAKRYSLDEIIDVITQAGDEVVLAINYRDRESLINILTNYLEG